MCPSALQVPPPFLQNGHTKTIASVSAHRLWCCLQSQIFQHMAFLGRWAALMCPEVSFYTFRDCSYHWPVCSREVPDLAVLAAAMPQASGRPGLCRLEAKKRCSPVQCSPMRPAPHCWGREQCPLQEGLTIPMHPDFQCST